MASSGLEVNVPSELVDLLSHGKLSSLPVEEQIRRALAIHLFITRQVSVGRAAELALMAYGGFLDLLNELGIPAFFYDENEAFADVSAAERFARRRAAS